MACNETKYVCHTYTLFYNWMGFVTCKEARHNAKQTLNAEILQVFEPPRLSFHGWLRK